VIEAAEVSSDEKNDAKENLQKLTDELNGEKNPGRISRFIVRLGQVVPAAAAILKGGGEIVELVKHLPNPFG
jgi:dihydrodipicolinate reductase